MPKSASADWRCCTLCMYSSHTLQNSKQYQKERITREHRDVWCYTTKENPRRKTLGLSQPQSSPLRVGCVGQRVSDTRTVNICSLAITGRTYHVELRPITRLLRDYLQAVVAGYLDADS